MRTIIAKLSRLMQAKMMGLVQQVLLAPTFATAVKRGQDLIAKFRDRYPAAMECLDCDLEGVTYLRFPDAHHPRSRTTNRLERLHGENRRRAKIIPRFRRSARTCRCCNTSLITASKHPRCIPMTVRHVKQFQQLRAAIAPPAKEEAAA